MIQEECPRCGFIQPSDRYCAYCGLDIESYKSHHVPPWYQKLLGNQKILVSLVLSVVLGTSTYIYFQSKKLHFLPTAWFDDHDEESSSTVFGFRAPTLEHKTIKDSSGDDSGKNRQPSSQKKDTNGRVVTQNPHFNAPSSEHETTAKHEPNSNHNNDLLPSQLIVRFAEFTRGLINALLPDSQVLFESQNFQALSYNGSKNMDELAKTVGPIHWLPGTLKGSIQGEPLRSTFSTNPISNSPLHSQGQPNSNSDNLLMQFAVQVTSINPLGVVFETAGDILIKTPSSATTTSGSATSTQRLPLSGTFTLGAKSILIIIPNLPRFLPNETDLKLLTQSPLSIFASSFFQNNESDLVIIIKTL